MAIGVVLLVSGGAKLRQPAWPATATAFGAPAWLVPALPWAELVLGALLVAGFGLPWTALAALGLLAAFTGAVGWRLARHDAVPCGCFGETWPAPVGPGTLVRNLLLCSMALTATVAPVGWGALGVIGGAALGLAVVGESYLRRSARR